MDLEPQPAILDVVEAGRGRRGSRGMRVPDAWVPADRERRRGGWSWLRAIVLSLLNEGWSYQVVAEELRIGRHRVGQLASEGCDAVLRSAPSSPEAEAACQPIWRWWCNQRGDDEACARM